MFRFAAFWSLAPHQGKNGKIKKPQDLMTLPIDSVKGKKKVRKIAKVRRVE